MTGRFLALPQHQQDLRSDRAERWRERADQLQDHALLRSWIHYDLAEWGPGPAWADSASRLDSNSSSRLITALLTAGSRQGPEAERAPRRSKALASPADNRQ
ncbi:MAG: hypothetical protein ABIF77_22190 [bacterium]